MTKTRLTVALISLTLIPLELIWTRIMSAEFFYTFAFLILSVAILGLGLGGLAVRLVIRLGQVKHVGTYLWLAALCAATGPALVFQLAPDFSTLFTSWVTIGKLILAILILMSSYFFGGMALAGIFRNHSTDIARLYMADLLGAGLGVLVAIAAMNFFGTPQASFLVALPILMAALLVSRGVARVIPVGLIGLLIFLSPRAGAFLELPRPERAPILFTHWDALSKIKVYDFSEEYRGLNIDNVANSPVYRFDGNWDEVDPDSVEWSIDVSYLISQFDSCVFLSLGAGGGSDVLQALVEGATEVHAVEVNDYINHLMLVDDTTGYVRSRTPAADSADVDSTAGEIGPMLSVAAFSGHIYRDPRVKVVSEDARAYVRRFQNKFDVIYSLSSNSWAALASGSFALAENYLFTTEAFMDYWQALSDSGFMTMEHQVYMPRLVSEIVEALTRLGVSPVTDHFAVYDLPQMRRKLVLISKRPLTDQIRSRAFGPLTDERFAQIHLLFPPANDSLRDNQYVRIISQGWQQESDSAGIDISPVTDNRPFVAQMGLWKNFTAEQKAKVNPYAEFSGFPLTKAMLVIVLGVVILIGIPVNLLPYLKTGPRLRPVPWLYFFAIGIAFMAVEVVLIQQFSLLIGPSLYGFATVLLTLLVASGLGSRWVARFGDRTPFVAIALWLGLNVLLFPGVVSLVGGWPLWPRLIVAAALLFPLGFFMGMPFPKATLRVGELVDWGFAVNGTASVLGSVLALMVSFTWGFSVALLLAALIYLGALALLIRHPAWSAPTSPQTPDHATQAVRQEGA